MNKRLKQLVVTTASLMLLESSPIWAIKDVYAAVENSIEMDQMKDVTISIEDAVTRINGGIDEASDYEILGIKNVSNDNINCIRDYIVKAKTSKLSDLTKEEIKEAVESALVDIGNAKNDIYLGKATEKDYEILHILEVNSKNIEDVNSILSGSRLSTISQIKGEVDYVIATINKINTGMADLSDYYSLKITIEKQEYLYIVNNQIINNKNNGNLTIKDIQAIIDEVNVNMKDVLAKIYDGNANVGHYKYICNYDVNTTNLEDVNEWVKGQKYRTIKKLTDDIDEIVSILARINNGEDTEEDYYELGINDVDESNIEEIRKLSKEKKAEQGTSLSKKDIEGIVSEVVNVLDLLEKVNNGTAVVEDYENAGLVNVNKDNVNDINKELLGREFTKINEVQCVINAVNEKESLSSVLEKVKEGTANIGDYTLLKVIGVTDSNIIFVNNELKGKEYASVEEVQKAVDENAELTAALEKVNEGKAAITDYEFLEVSGVTEKNASKVNELVFGKNIVDKAELKEFVESNIDKINEAINLEEVLGKVKEGTALVGDYASIKITGVTDSNIIFVNNELKGKEYASVEEVQKAVDENAELTAALEKVNEGKAAVTDYEFLEVSGVAEKNVSKVNELVLGKNIVDKAELKEFVESNIDEINEAINLEEVLGKVKEGTASVGDYALIKITGVTDSNIIFVNNELKGKEYASVEEVQKAVDENAKLTAALEKVNKGEAVTTDYEFLEVSGVTEKNVSKVNELIKGKDFLDKDEIEEFVEENIDDINEAINLQDVLKKIKEGTADEEDYASIKVSGVTAGNILFVNYELKGNDYISAEEVQTVVDEYAKLNEALEKVNAGEAEVSDYEFLEVTEVTEINLSEVNELLKGKEFVDKEEIRGYIEDNIRNINQKIKLNEVLRKIQEGTAVEEDYASIKVSGVTEGNIAFVNDELKNKVYSSSQDVQQEVDKYAKLNDAIMKILSGEAVLEDYSTLGVSDVTESNLEYVNYDVKGKTYTDVKSLKDDLNTIVQVNNRYIKINNGNGTLDDYEYLNISGITTDNIDYVNTKVKNNVNINEKNLQSVVTEIIQSKDENNNQMTPPVDDGFDIYAGIKYFWNSVVKFMNRVIKFILDIFRW